MDIVTLGVIGAVLWSFLVLIAVAVCRAAARADDASLAEYAKLVPSGTNPSVPAAAAANSEPQRAKRAPQLVLR